MDQPNLQSLQSPKPPSTQVNQELPHLVVEEPKRGIAGTLGVLFLSLMLLGIPVGIFLVSQRTQLEPQAAVEERLPEVVSGIFLESKLNLESQGGVIPVDIYVKSPVDEVNLVNARIKFDPNLLSVEKVATSAAEVSQQSFFNKWFEAGFDNTKGEISIIAGLPNPGIKTGGATDDKAYVATVHLRPRKTGTAVLQITPESQVLRNNDNNNIFKTGNDLVLSLTSVISEASGSAKPAADENKDEPLLVITGPEAAANYSYFKSVNIKWSSFNVDRISQINLYVNNDPLGAIAQNLDAEDGQFEWKPGDTLALPYIQLSNTFKIELIGVSKDGEVAKVISAPFGILGTENAAGAAPNLQAFSKNQLSVLDASRALSNYLVLPLQEKSLDLNKDEVVNELDLFLIRQNLIMRGIIK